MTKKIVADTSVIINGQLASQIESGSIRTSVTSELIIPQVVFDEMQAQAVSGRGKKTLGLEAMVNLRNKCTEFGLHVSSMGDHVSVSDVSFTNSGRIDAIIIDVTQKCGATLYTSDKIQHLTAKSRGIPAVLLYGSDSLELSDTKAVASDQLDFLQFFDDNTMSVHLKEQQVPLAKRGHPGDVCLVEITSSILGRKYLESMAMQIVDTVDATEQSTIEISSDGAMVLQHDDYRIAITRPPFSESLEITIVHPTVKMSLSDYEMSDSLLARLKEQAEGIVISGQPGSGKSTLASGFGNFYHQMGKIVKTFESPRDLQVDSGITQYGKLDGSFENSADLLLLVRPDYTIFDEVRRREDFEVFADLRLTGVGMIGVVHANTPIDAIQRFIGKIELGMIPSILDTVIFVKGGRIDAVYDLNLEVKVPSGMTESDLARPVIVVRDIKTNAPVYEVYTFGEENVIMPISSTNLTDALKSGVYNLAADKIRDVVKKYDRNADVQMISDNRAVVIVSKKYKARIIGKNGTKVEQLQDHLGVHLDIRTREEAQVHESEFHSKTDLPFGDHDDKHSSSSNNVYKHDDVNYAADDDLSFNSKTTTDSLEFSIKRNRNLVVLDVGSQYASRNVEILDYTGKQIITAWINKKGAIKLSTRTSGGRTILDMQSPVDDMSIHLLRD